MVKNKVKDNIDHILKLNQEQYQFIYNFTNELIEKYTREYGKVNIV